VDRVGNDVLRHYMFRELLNRLFQVYGQNFLPFIMLSAAVQIPLTVANYLIQVRLRDPLLQLLNRFNISPDNAAVVSPEVAMQMLSPLLEILLVVLGAYIVSSFIQTVLVSGPLTYVTSENELGRPATLGSAFPVLGSRAGTLVGQMCLYYTLLLLLTVLLTFILFACGLGFGLLVYVATTVGAFLVPVAMLERGGVMNGLMRAWMLCKTRLWPVLGLILIVLFISFVVSAALDAVETAYAPPNSEPIIRIILETIVSILLMPVLPVGFTLLYYDARVRSEGLDTALKRAQLTNPAASPADVPPPPPGPFIRNEDFLNLAIVTMAMFVLALLYFGATFLLSGGSAGMMGRF
jgi:hypothetical protein